MQKHLRVPTPELVTEACAEFDREFWLTETALHKLITHFPENSDLPEVLLKVVSLNRLYSTQILAVSDMANHICRNGAQIDRRIAAGDPEVVEEVGNVIIQATGKTRYNYSFATKYCSWHNPEAYPIWDSRVDKYLWQLQKEGVYTAFVHSHLGYYGKFLNTMKAFRSRYHLDSFTFKQIDKFIWLEAGRVDLLPVQVSDLPAQAP